MTSESNGSSKQIIINSEENKYKMQQKQANKG